MTEKWTQIRVKAEVVARLKALRERREASRQQGHPALQTKAELISLSDMIEILIARAESKSARARKSRRKRSAERRAECMEAIYEPVDPNRLA